MPRKSSRHRLVVYLTVAQRDALLLACHHLGTDAEELVMKRQELEALDNAADALRIAQPMTLRKGGS